MSERVAPGAGQRGDDKPWGEADPGRALAARVLDAAELFQGQREIWIVLDGERYRLRITRRNRLILQK